MNKTGYTAGRAFQQFLQGTLKHKEEMQALISAMSIA